MGQIPRETYMRQVRPFMHLPVVKVLTGIRRCGKSIMLDLIRAEVVASGVPETRTLALNFESAQDPRVRSADSVLAAVRERAGHGKVYLFFDEIQELSGWETLINSLLVDLEVDVYLTGSNAKLLSGELATYLAGRYIEIPMYPFSFAEVYELSTSEGLQPDSRALFQTYLVKGGFPFLYQYPLDDNGVHQYLGAIFDSVILKDIVQRNQVRDVGLLQRLITFFFANVGNTFSATSLTKFLKNQKRSASTETIYNYIEYCRNACLLHLAPREDLLGKDVLATQEKIYLVDHGLRETIYGNNRRDINQVLENIVYVELLRRGYTVTVGRVRDAEVDFCARKAAQTMYVQVAYLLAEPQTVEREFSALQKIPDNYAKYVVSLDEIDRSQNGIVHLNLADFLLSSGIP